MKFYKVLLLTAMLSSILIFASCGPAALNNKQADKSAATLMDVFVIGEGIGLNLTETTREYKVLPGADIAKDPKVTVTSNAGGCWVFIKVESTLPDYITYTIDDAWTTVDGVDGVYYIENCALGTYPVLEGNHVVVDADVSDVSDAADSTFTVTAYAIELGASDTLEGAWAALMEEL